MSKKTLRKTVITIGLIIVALVATCVIVAYFLFGANLRQVRVPDYVITQRAGDHYEFSLDTERIIWDQHLPNPPESELPNFPEIAAIRSLNVYVTHDGQNYRFETVSSADDPNLTKTLKRAGIVLKNTQWTWTENDIIGSAATQPTDGFTELSLPDYVILTVENGKYVASLNHTAMLAACGFDLPLDPTQHSGYNAITSLSVDCQPSEGNYRFQTQSTLDTIMTLLAENRIRILSTTWTWTPAEMAKRASVPTAEQPREQNPGPEQPAASTPAPHPSDRIGITTLYGFDQTDVRTAIRTAKELHYGSSIESCAVYQNYFAVGSETTPHTNVFRIVYEIATDSGQEYLIADMCDLYAESGYNPADVQLRAVSTRSEARSTEDLKDYTLYTLNGGSMVFPENADKSPFDDNGFVCAHSITEPLSYNELWDIPATADLTLLQLLAYARNEMYARAGNQYDTTGSYYRHFASYSWYDPTGTVSLTELADKWPVAGQNVSTIKFLEKLIREG